MATRNGCLECIQLLIAAGANLHAADRVRLGRVEGWAELKTTCSA